MHLVPSHPKHAAPFPSHSPQSDGNVINTCSLISDVGGLTQTSLETQQLMEAQIPASPLAFPLLGKPLITTEANDLMKMHRMLVQRPSGCQEDRKGWVTEAKEYWA